jgi:hypothetical protein
MGLHRLNTYGVLPADDSLAIRYGTPEAGFNLRSPMRSLGNRRCAIYTADEPLYTQRLDLYKHKNKNTI